MAEIIGSPPPTVFLVRKNYSKQLFPTLETFWEYHHTWFNVTEDQSGVYKLNVISHDKKKNISKQITLKVIRR